MNPLLEVLPRDLQPYRKGNTGIDYVHRFESGRPGPNVLINALTHGNEFCGMTALTHLLDTGVRPKIGSLTLSFANVAAYESFDPERPFESRQLVHNFNRIWSEELLNSDQTSSELVRARQLRPVFAQADHLLDLHSTSQAVEPFWVYRSFERNGAAARAVAQPSVHMVMPQGLGSGVPIIEYGRFADASGTACALVAECGQHFLHSSSVLAIEVARNFLSYFGLLEADRHRPLPPQQRRFELLSTRMVKSTAFRFTGPYIGFECFAKDALIATDADEEIRAPCDDCTILMPTRRPVVGREAVYLTRPID
jgi:predicted deacylase